MREKQRIITVLTVVVMYNLVDQFFIREKREITDSSVYISLGIAMVLYVLLILFFRRKHPSGN